MEKWWRESLKKILARDSIWLQLIFRIRLNITIPDLCLSRHLPTRKRAGVRQIDGLIPIEEGVSLGIWTGDSMEFYSWIVWIIDEISQHLSRCLNQGNLFSFSWLFQIHRTCEMQVVTAIFWKDVVYHIVSPCISSTFPFLSICGWYCSIVRWCKMYLKSYQIS